MKRSVYWLTKTAVLLALLVTLQAVTKPLGQLVTGSCVNALLAVACMFGGLSCGITVAVTSPVLAFLLGIAPQVLTVPAIMVGNVLYVVVLYLLAGRGNQPLWQKALALVSASVVKFCALYGIVAGLVCGLLSESLLASGALKAPMLKVLPVTFGVAQLFTALIGGGVAMLIVPILRRALRK